jgi:hypothetical protein
VEADAPARTAHDSNLRAAILKVRQAAGAAEFE